MSYSGPLTEREMEAGRAHTADLLRKIVQLMGPPTEDADPREPEAIIELIEDDLASYAAHWQRRYQIERNYSEVIDRRASEAISRADRAESALRPYADVFEAVIEYLTSRNPDQTDLSLLRSRVKAIEEAM